MKMGAGTLRLAARLVLLVSVAGHAEALPPRRAERALAQAKALADAGRTDEAIAALARLLETNPALPEAHLLYVALRCATGRAVVQKEYEAKLKADPDNALLHFLAGYAEAEPAARRARYLKAIALDPDLFEAQLELGRLCRTEEARDLPTSRQALETAANLRPESPEAHLELARTLAALGQAPDAIASYRRALELNRAQEAAWFELACLLSAQLPDEAERALAQGVAACPASGRLWWHLADFQWARGAHRDAATSLERALELGPQAAYAPAARDRLAAYYLTRGWHRSARRLGATAWGQAAVEMADGALAPEAFRLLLDATATAAGADPAAALDALQKAAGRSPRSGVVQERLADALFAAGRYEAAAAAYSLALRARTHDADLRLRAATAELLAGQPGAAASILQSERRRLSREALWLLADAEALAASKAQGRPPEGGATNLAAAVAARLTASGVSSVEFRGPSSQSAIRNPQSAIGRLERLRACVERFPDYLTARLELAHVLGEAGKGDEARAALADAARLKGHPLAEADLHAQLGDMALADNAFPKAVEHYKAAVERCPELARSHGALARALFAQGELGAALDALTRQLGLDPRSYDLPSSGPPGKGSGCLLAPRLRPGQVLRYRYTTDGGQPGHALATVDLDLIVRALGAGETVECALRIVAVGGRTVEGGREFVGARIPFRCSTCFGLLAVEAPPRRVPREFAHLLWLTQFLLGPALPAPRWPGQRWQATAWGELGKPYGGEVEFERLDGARAYLRSAFRHERPGASPASELERVAVSGRAAIVFHTGQRVVERVEATLSQTLTTRRGSRAELAPWLDRIELIRPGP